MNLKKILKGVSRSFYLSLILLPRRIRKPMGLAFLACKAADTIADTKLIPKPERLKLLDSYREMFATQADGSAKLPYSARYPVVKNGVSSAEAALIEALPDLMEALSRLDTKDWLLIQELVLELTQGMQMDLQFFPGETEQELKSFQTMEELERYIYYVAGCVGRFWTGMICQHFSFAQKFDAKIEDLGEKLGKGLQLVNILRDLPRDLRQGRCYIPTDLLAKQNLKPKDLLNPKILSQAQPVLSLLIGQTKNYLESYKTYCHSFPAYTFWLKAVVKLPARLGFKTLELLENSKVWLDPITVHKVSRGQVYQTLLASFFV